MAAPEGNQNALGNPGGGRPTLQDEKLKAMVINKSWQRINKKFEKSVDGTNTQLEKELDVISLEVAKKSIPKDINLRSQKTISEILNDIEDEQPA